MSEKPVWDKDAIHARILHIAGLKADWDDEGAVPVNIGAIGLAEDVAVACLPHQCGIGPCPDGTIDLFWRRDPCDDLYVHIETMYVATACRVINGEYVTTKFDGNAASHLAHFAKATLEGDNRP